MPLVEFFLPLDEWSWSSYPKEFGQLGFDPVQWDADMESVASSFRSIVESVVNAALRNPLPPDLPIKASPAGAAHFVIQSRLLLDELLPDGTTGPLLDGLFRPDIDPSYEGVRTAFVKRTDTQTDGDHDGYACKIWVPQTMIDDANGWKDSSVAALTGSTLVQRINSGATVRRPTGMSPISTKVSLADVAPNSRCALHSLDAIAPTPKAHYLTARDLPTHSASQSIAVKMSDLVVRSSSGPISITDVSAAGSPLAVFRIFTTGANPAQFPITRRNADGVLEITGSTPNTYVWKNSTFGSPSIERTGQPNKHNVLIVGGLVANHWAVPTAICQFAEDLINLFDDNFSDTSKKAIAKRWDPEKGIADHQEEIAELLAITNLYLVPSGNPDGLDFFAGPQSECRHRQRGLDGQQECDWEPVRRVVETKLSNPRSDARC